MTDGLEREITDAIRRHPGIFPTRIYVLNHMFLVTGNGTEWEDGELTYNADSRPTVKEGLASVRGSLESAKESHETIAEELGEDRVNGMRDETAKRIRRLRKIVFGAQKYAKTGAPEIEVFDVENGPLKTFKPLWYGLNKYSAGHPDNVPSDANTPFVAGAIETFLYGLHDPDKWETEEGQFPSGRDWNEEQEKISHVLSALSSRFPEARELARQKHSKFR